MLIRTRFAPSPTGFLHIGALRTAVYEYAFAKNGGGEFVFRIEDTDQKRSVSGAIENFKNFLKIFHLNWDELYIQSERAKEGIYKKAAQQLVKEGHAFYCECKPKNAKEEGFSKELRDSCRDLNLTTGAIKLKVPDNEKVSFHDFVIDKDISWDTSDLADTTLLKSDGFPTYHLAVVVDDHDMRISHVLRGHEWLPSTPIHLLLYKFLGYEVPEIGHLTDILSPQGGKLSKRRGAVSVDQFLTDGYLPEALLNFVILLGWAPKDNREIFSLDEFVKIFNPAGFQKSNPIFNKEKLDWFNGYYIRQLSVDDLNSKFIIHNSKFKTLEKSKQRSITKLIQDRIKKINDLDQLAGFFFERPKVEKSLLGKNSVEHLASALVKLENIKNWTKEEIDKSLLDLVKEKDFKTGDFFMDLRIAICGSKFTPPINDSIVILGKEETLARIKELLQD